MRIAIVEDSATEAEILCGMLDKYAQARNQTFEMAVQKNAIIFLNDYKAEYDLIFMDIQMPYMDGMQAAEKMRCIDSVTPLIFVTNLAQMAAQGYQVSAFAFLVKPLDYDTFVMHMDRFMHHVAVEKDMKVILPCAEGRTCFPASDILYVEIRNHHLIYHTLHGDYKVYNSLKSARETLPKFSFSMCSSCYLVNLRHVRRVQNYTVQVSDIELQISHPRKKLFLDALNAYIGG